MSFLLKNMRISAPILTIIMLFLCPGWLLAGNSAGSHTPLQEDSAQVIHESRGRVYIDKGILDGIKESWNVVMPDPYGDSVEAAIQWSGKDISYFTKPDTVYYFFQIGEKLALHKYEQAEGKNYKITLAFPHIPALPHEGTVDFYDRQFQSLISIPLKINTIDFTGIQNPQEERYDIRDVYYSMQYFSSYQAISSYNLKYLPELSDSEYYHWDPNVQTVAVSPLIEKGFWEVVESIRPPLLKAPAKAAIESLFAVPGDLFVLKDSLPKYDITSGPYNLAKLDKQEILLLKNRSFAKNNKFPDTILIKIEPDYLKRKLMFQLGEIDMLDLHFSDVDQFKGDYIIKEAELDEAAYLSVNNIKEYLSDGVMAAALSYMINKNALCRVALNKSAQPVDNLLPEWVGISEPMYAYNQSKGQSLIRKIGGANRYLSLYVNPDDFWGRRTAEYIKGMLERENIYVTIYSELLKGEGRDYDLFQQFDMMIGRIDMSNQSPPYILNQMVFHYDLADISNNRSLYFSEEHDSIMTIYFENSKENEDMLKEYYRDLVEFPAGIPLFQPIRQTAISGRIKKIEFTDHGLIDFSTIEIKDETQR